MPRASVRPVLLVGGTTALSESDLQVLDGTGLPRPEHVATLHEAAARLAVAPHSLVLLPVRGPDTALDAFGQLLRTMPDAVSIAVGPTRDTDAVLAAMRAGIGEFLMTPLQPGEVHAALTRLSGRAVSPAVRTPSPVGRVFAVLAAKGGMGTSTVAASLAAVLASGAPGNAARVALVDFTASGAGLRVMLNVDPPHDLTQLQHREDTIDAPFVQSLLHEHDGVSLLVGGAADAPDSLPATTASQLITTLRQLFDFIVIDTDRFLTEQTLSALDAADRILIVTQPEILALRGAQQALALCVRLGYRDDTIQVILNRTTDRDRLTVEEVQRILGRSISAVLPNAYRSCHDAIAAGAFLPRHSRDAALTSGFRAVADVATGATKPAPVVRRVAGFGALFRRGARA